MVLKNVYAAMKRSNAIVLGKKDQCLAKSVKCEILLVLIKI